MTEKSRPLPLSTLEYSTLKNIGISTVGRSISQVRYGVLPPPPSPVELDAAPVHEANSVEVGFDSGDVLQIQWAMDGANEGLSLIVSPNFSVVDIHVVDVTGTSQWKPLLGGPIVSLRLAWHACIEVEDGSELLWAISLRTEGGGEVAVALGELEDNSPSYIPDSLVVLFSSESADEYQPLACRTSAWGESVNIREVDSDQ